jgi:hypothetical protein
MISPLPKGDSYQFARTRRQEIASFRVKVCWSERTRSHAPEQSLHLILQKPTPAPMPLGTSTAGVMMWGGPPSINPRPFDPIPQFIRRQVQSRRSRRSFSTPEIPVMAASSSRPLPVEERLKQLDEKLEKLKNMLQYQLDFLENLDSEAGRRMEQLEQDLSFVKIGFTEELDKLHQELKSPQERFEDRIGGLEDKLAKLNLEWGDSSEK